MKVFTVFQNQLFFIFNDEFNGFGLNHYLMGLNGQQWYALYGEWMMCLMKKVRLVSEFV